MHRAGGPVPDTGLDVAAWTRATFELALGLPGVGRVGLALVEGGGRRLRFTASDRPQPGDDAWCHVDAYDDVPLNAAVRSGEPVHGSLDDLEPRYPAFVERQRGTGTAAVAAVPLVAYGQVLGGLVLFFEGPQSFGEDRARELVRIGEERGAALRGAQRARVRLAAGLSEGPSTPGSRVAVHAVPSDLAAVGGARRFLRRTLAEWGLPEGTADTAVLCLSELVTNAVVHTQAGCSVRVVQDRGVLTTSVRDGGRFLAGAEEPPEDPLRVHGRGLQVVEALASRWGSELDAVGTTVWFVLDV